MDTRKTETNEVLNNVNAPDTVKPAPLAESQMAVISQGRRVAGEGAAFEMDKDGFITTWSNKAGHMYGYECDVIIGKHIASLYTPGDLMFGTLIHELKAVQEYDVYSTFCWQKRKNGQEFWAQTECEALRDSDGWLLGYRKFVLEILSSTN